MERQLAETLMQVGSKAMQNGTACRSLTGCGHHFLFPKAYRYSSVLT
jgi:hypothetical protein